MTNQDLDKNRFKIVKDYFKSSIKLDLNNDLDLLIYCSKEGLYHIFMNDIHQYSLSDKGLQKLVKILKIETIKKIYIASKVINLTKKAGQEFNPLDFENYA